MSKRIIIHDERVFGKIKTKTAEVIRVGKSDSVKEIFNKAAGYAQKKGGLDDLIILAHGSFNSQFDSKPGSELADLNSSFEAVGPVGIAVLGKEKLTNFNIVHTRALEGLVTSVYLVCCSIADSPEKRLRNTRWDGRLLCKNLAGYTNAEVFASSSLQDYSFSGIAIFNTVLYAGEIDLTTVLNMEAPVYRFSPLDGEQTIVQR